MTVLIVERVPPGLRGELTRWLLEPKAGVFVGRITAAVRARLWAKVLKSANGGSAVLLYATDSEQGYAIETAGDRDRAMRDFDGLWLITTR